jgi:HJR/Mrr/RecB family endonuclease
MGTEFDVIEVIDSYESGDKKQIFDAIEQSNLRKLIHIWKEISSDKQVWTKQKLADPQLSGIAFERLVFNYFSSKHDSRRTSQTMDGGCDVLLRLGPDEKIAVEVKHKSREGSQKNVGVSVVRKALNTDHSNVVGEVIVTTTGFSTHAIRKAETENVRLIGGEEFSVMLNERGIGRFDFYKKTDCLDPERL